MKVTKEALDHLADIMAEAQKALGDLSRAHDGMRRALYENASEADMKVTPEIEAVARALCKAERVDPDDMESDLRPTKSGHGTEFCEVPAWTKRIHMAIAALEALERPTLAMQRAARAKLEWLDKQPKGACVCLAFRDADDERLFYEMARVEAAYQAMLRSALGRG